MRNVKIVLCATMLLAMLACAFMTVSGPSSAEENQRDVVRNHWRHHDGHWNYWHDADQRWYYTDGSNWYYNTGDAWNIYNFDKKFGGEGFERGDYKAPAAGVKIETPRHGIYREKAK